MKGAAGRYLQDFLSSTDVGRRVPATDDAVSEGSEKELLEWEEGQETQRVSILRPRWPIVASHEPLQC